MLNVAQWSMGDGGSGTLTDQDLRDTAGRTREQILGCLQGTAALGLDVNSSRISHIFLFLFLFFFSKLCGFPPLWRFLCCDFREFSVPLLVLLTADRCGCCDCQSTCPAPAAVSANNLLAPGDEKYRTSQNVRSDSIHVGGKEIICCGVELVV